MQIKVNRQQPRTVALSFSRIKDFETCPKQFHGKHIAKLPQSTNDAIQRGNAVHKAIEQFVGGGGALNNVPSADAVKTLIDSLRSQGMHLQAEVPANFSDSWRPVKDKWSKDVWFRSIFDIVALGGTEAVILDWKTGKRRFDPKQLQIFATGAFLTNPQVKHVTTCFVWLDQTNPPDVVEYGPEIVQETVDMIEAVADQVERSKIKNEWDTRPGRHCGWCPLKGVCPDAQR